MIKFIDEKKYRSGYDEGEKYCAFRWLGLKSGPAFIMTDKAGNTVVSRAEVAQLTDDFLKSTAGQQYSTMRQFGEEATHFAEKRGWVVTANDYTDGGESSISEAEMTDAEIREFKERLRAGIVTFKYRKVSKPAKVNRKTGEVTPAVEGEVVTRRGTLSEDIINRTMEQVEAAERAHRIPNESVITYFDVGAENRKTGKTGDWRCFKVGRFEGYAED